MRGTNVEETVEFAGLTSHNQTDMTGRAASIAGLDASDTPDTSFATAIRQLETAATENLAWKVPGQAADHLDAEQLSDKVPEGVEVLETQSGDIYVKTDRFQSVYSPDKVQDWLSGEVEDDDGEYRDPLWHVPTKDYSITNPESFYNPLEEEIREQDLGDHMFGEIRTFKGGGEVHMDIMFDAFQVTPDDNDGPIILGIRTGYDFFGGTALYAEGYAQDTSCDNSIRSVTGEKSRRHVGDIEDTNEWWADILEQMELMTDTLSEAIEAAQVIDLDYLSMNFSEAFNHDDDLRAFYELSGFPSYLATEAASNVQSRADNQFLPNMWELHSGATYALTHQYRGGENSTTMSNYVQAANDMLFNPSQTIGTVERSYSQRLERQSQDGEEQGDLDGETASAKVADFRNSVSDQKEEYETRREQLEEMLVAVGDDGEAVTDGGENE